MATHQEFEHPHDTPLSSGFRFLSEIIAWVAGPWAASQVHPLFAAAVLIALIGLPTVFSTRGDKRHMIVDTPGPFRVLIELLQYGVAAFAPWLVWPNLVAAVCTVIVISGLVLGLPRLRWLVRGAPAEE
jgi:hypothetical protein